MNFLNNITAFLYDRLFDWNTYGNLSGMVFDKQDYGKLGLLLILVPILALIGFYKLWDPVSGSKLKWYLAMLFVALLSYAGTSIILYSNIDIEMSIINYTGEIGEANPDSFIFQLSLLSLIYSVIIGFILSIIPFRLVSTNNRYNPF